MGGNCESQACQTLFFCYLDLAGLCHLGSMIHVLLLFALFPWGDQQNHDLDAENSVPGILTLPTGGKCEGSDVWLILGRVPGPWASH